MYILYVDESGDTGHFHPDSSNTGTPYFILAGLIISVEKWHDSLILLKNSRTLIAKNYHFPYVEEIHCSELINRNKKAYNQISKKDSWDIIYDFSRAISNIPEAHILTAVIDKKTSNINNEDYLKVVITDLYSQFQEFLDSKASYGIVVLDKVNNNKVSVIVRQIMETTGERKGVRKINRIIEDPLLKDSAGSHFVQAADTIAYTLKESLFPNGSAKKFQSNQIFNKTLSKIKRPQ